MPKKLTNIEFIEKSSKIHNNKFDYSLVDYQGNRKRIKIICPEHGEFNQSSKNHLKGVGCQKCALKINLVKAHDSLRLTKEQFIQKSIEKHNYKYDYSLAEYVNNDSRVKIICPKHGLFEQSANNHLRGNGCKKCQYENQKITLEEFKMKANKQHDDKYDYSNVLTCSCYEKIKIICPKHGLFEQVVYSHLEGKGCPACSNSKGEKTISFFLKESKIIFEPQKKFDGLKDKRPLRIDFYLPKYNVCIEYDGEQHFKQMGYTKLNRLSDIQRKDEIKNNFCRKNNIRLIRINYKQNIINELNLLKNSLI
jgi:hypothetical protein